jgi:hypothetical protein
MCGKVIEKLQKGGDVYYITSYVHLKKNLKIGGIIEMNC